MRLLGFYLGFFTVSVTPSINRQVLSSDSTILIISFMSSFEINEVIPFPANTAPLSKIDEVALVANLGKTSLAKGTVKCNNV